VEINVIRQEGYELLHDGAIELARIESNGIRIDINRLNRTKEKLSEKIRTLKHGLETTEIWKVWKRRFGEKASVTSGDQLATVLYEEMGYAVVDTTEGGKPSTDEEALAKIDHPEIPGLVRLAKYQKALGTYLKGIERELVGDRIHPFFNLHTARTYRSSSDSPNFQNQPVRDKEISKIIRSCFIASEGCLLVENDFKGIEVSLSAAYHHDPVFIDYISTPGKDMHRDMAAQIYCLKPKQVSKDCRYGAKNKFVFPQFYGDFYVSCAKSLWEWIDKGKLTGPDGQSLRDHLKANSITKLGKCDPEIRPVEGTFEHHLKEVENDFWNRRFMVYGQWRKDWYRQYLDKGYFDLLTGFRIHGSYPRNAVVNYPVQGSAFHCLLWSLIQVNRLLRKYKMKSLVVGQIHDSLIGDIRVDELVNYLEIVEKVTTVDLRKRYEWLVVPPEIEYELAPLNGSWFEKKEIKFKLGKFYHPDKPDKFTTDPLKLLEIISKKAA
jgi:DNA polymerase I-like protein with 3'-5' exonuclease and polymerase domains